MGVEDVSIMRPLITFAAVAALAACTGSQMPCPSVPSQTGPAAPAAAPASTDDVIEARASGARFEFVFHASRFSSLAYQMDCLAGIIRCSKDAYEALWRDELGGLSKEDERALEEWGALKFTYRGQAERRPSGDVAVDGLPLLPTALSVGRIIRSAGYRSDSVDRFAADLGLFATSSDIARARALIERFEARYEPFWTKSVPIMRKAAEGYAAILQKDLAPLVEQVAAFYGAEMPAHAELSFDLVARPAHESDTSGEFVGHRMLVEVLPGETPAQRVFVVLHELCHYLHWSARRSDLAALATRILDADDPIATPAYGLLDEALATAFGSGMVQRRVNPREFERRIGKPEGLYGEPLIDGGARAVLPLLEALLAEGGTIHDPAFVPRYLEALKRGFPSGMAPRAWLRDWTCAHEPELDGSRKALVDAVWSTQVTCTSSIDARDVSETFKPRSRWTHVVMVRTGEAKKLASLAPWIEKVDAEAVQRQSHKTGPFIYGSVRRGKAPLFVFVAPGDDEMKALVSRFVALQTFRNGVLAD